MSWKEVTLGELLEPRESRIKHEDANTLGLKRIKKIDFSGIIHYEDRTETRTDMILVKRGDLVVSGINAAKGAIAVHELEEDVLATIHYSSYRFRPDVISSLYLKWFFRSPQFADLIQDQVPGGIKTEIKSQHLLPLKTRLPSIKEQIDIAESLSIIDDYVKELELEIALQEDVTEKLRLAVLAEAVQGAVTDEWRRNSDQGETVEEFLQRIDSTNLAKNCGKKLLPVDASEFPHQIPKSWTWERLGSLLLSKPRNGLSLKPVDRVTKTKTLKLSATTSGTFDGSKIKYLDAEIDSDSHLWLKDGDLLVQRSNSIDFVGTSAIYRGKDNDYIYPDLIMKCRAAAEQSIEYLHIVLSSPYVRHYFRENATGSAGNMPKINQGVVMNTLIPLPPGKEQIEIVDRVKRLLEVCRSAKSEQSARQEMVDQLSTSAISKAFDSAACQTKFP